MPIRRDDPRPPFEQLAAELRGAIDRGDYQVGDKLPAQRQLAVDYGIAPNTVRRALEQLAEEGRIVAQHGSGHWVTEPPVEDTSAPAKTVEERLAEAERRIEATTAALEEANSRLERLELAPVEIAEPDLEPGPEPATEIDF